MEDLNPNSNQQPSRLAGSTRSQQLTLRLQPNSHNDPTAAAGDAEIRRGGADLLEFAAATRRNSPSPTTDGNR